jgi:hypothetical protein
MTFLHPWALVAGALAVGLPLAIHWLTRPRPVRLPLSTIRFVMEAVQQRRARYRLRDFIILALRALAVALIAYAFARPLTGSAPLVLAESSGDTTRIVILDRSQSMAAGSRGIVAFERARPLAAKYLSGGAGARGNLILAGAKPQAAFERVSSNFAAMREELATAKPRGERLNLQAAVNLAAEMLSAGGEAGRKKELVVISDFQRADPAAGGGSNNSGGGVWASVDFSALPKDTAVQLESVAPKDVPANLGVLRVAAAGRAEQGREVTVEVDVGNFSPTPRDVKAELRVGDQAFPLEGHCPPNGKVTLAAQVTPASPGWQTGEARLVGVEDALPADDARPFVLDVRPTPSYALITREPSTPRPSSSHFLERALAPNASREPADGGAAANARGGARVQRIEPGQMARLDKESVSSADLIVLDHPGKLSPEGVSLLAALLRRGRGVLYVAAEPVDATNLKLLSDAVGADWKLPVRFAPPPAGRARRDLPVTEYRKDQSPLTVFGEDLPAALGPLRFGGGLATERDESGLLDDIVATYGDRSAALVVSNCGAGALGVLNADLDESNLPGSAAFVPLLAELANRLMGRHGSEAAAASGEPLTRDLPPDAGVAAGLEVRGPADAGPANLGSLSDEGSFVLWHADAAGPPGVYEVKRDGATVFAAAAVIPPGESDLAPTDPNALTGRLAGARAVSFQSAGEDTQQRDDTWAWVLAACCGCLLCEIGALLAFRT